MSAVRNLAKVPGGSGSGCLAIKLMQGQHKDAGTFAKVAKNALNTSDALGKSAKESGGQSIVCAGLAQRASCAESAKITLYCNIIYRVLVSHPQTHRIIIESPKQ